MDLRPSIENLINKKMKLSTKPIVSLAIGLLAGVFGSIAVVVFSPSTVNRGTEIQIPDSIQIEEISASDGHVYCLGVDCKYNQHIIKF